MEQNTPAVFGPVERMVRPGAEAPTLPEPAGFRTRYRSEPGMIGHYPWAYADAGRRKGNRPECEYEDLFTAEQMRTAVEAARMAGVRSVQEQTAGNVPLSDPLGLCATGHPNPGEIDSGRAEIVSRARQMRRNIAQIFDDAAHWNSQHVPWKGKPIDPDPDGQLRRIADGLDRMLTAEDARPNAKAERPETAAKE